MQRFLVVSVPASLVFACLVCAGLVFLAAPAQAEDAAAPAAAAPAAPSDGVIGTIIAAEGDVTVTPPGQPAARAAAETPLHLNDVIETGAAARAFVQFIDDTQITLAEGTKLRVDQYVFDADSVKDNKADYNILRGAFSYVSGLIAKKDDPDVHIEIPYGSIGIRGTALWAGVTDGEYGVQVDEGQVAVATQAGETVVGAGQGASLRGRDVPPGPAKAWPAEKLREARASVALGNRAEVMKRAAAFGARREALRSGYRDYLKTHPGGAAHPVEPGSWRERYQARKWQKEQQRPYTHRERRSPLRHGGTAYRESVVLGSSVRHNKAPAAHEKSPPAASAHAGGGDRHQQGHQGKSPQEKSSGGGRHGKH